jgi:hypothetical protein
VAFEGNPMKRCVDLALGMVLGAAATTTLVAVAADSPSLDPVKISPRHYTVRLENDRVRVLEWRLESGRKRPDAQSTRPARDRTLIRVDLLGDHY